LARCAAKARVFETDDGRTFAGAVASFLKFVVFIAFFLKPLSVTLPFAARFTGRETASRARQRIKNPAKAKTVTAAEGQEGAAGAVFDLASNLGLVSDERAANGGVMAGVKKGEDTQPNSPFWGARRKRRQSFSDGVLGSRGGNVAANYFAVRLMVCISFSVSCCND